MDDDEVQSRFDNALAAEEGTPAADKPKDDQETEVPEENQPKPEGQPESGEETPAPATPPAAPAADDEPDEDDGIEDLDFAPPILSGATPQGAPQQFDIRNLPRDENGAIIPDQANKAIQEWHEQQLSAIDQSGKQSAEVRNVLSSQWQRGFTQYPHIGKNKDLATLARDLHLSSITAAREGTGKYYSPLAAMKRVDAMYKKAAEGGYQSSKTRRTIVKNATTETPGGKGEASKPVSEYEAARKMAQSTDPKTAKAGRLKMMEIRRTARAPQ